MMEANPTDHELNQVLARVVRVAIHLDKREAKWWCDGDLGGWEEWNPLHDANQMDLVEEKLNEKHGWLIERRVTDYFVRVFLLVAERGSTNNWSSHHTDKKRAFALAVYAMEKGKEAHV